MARTFSRPIFKRKSRLHLRGILGGALLLLSAGALVAGIFGALYLDHFDTARAVQVAQPAPSIAPSRPFAVAEKAAAHTVAAAPTASPESPPAGPPPLPTDLRISTAPAGAPQPAVEPASGSSEPPVAAKALASPPSAMPDAHDTETVATLPAPVAPAAAPASPSAASPTVKAVVPPKPAPQEASDVYWVEYGAYATPHYAKRLRQSLAKIGLETSLNYVPGRGGRHYYRVRSAATSDRAAARTAVAKARKALDIAPLLHHEHRRPDAAHAVAAASVGASPLLAQAVHDRHYWVQFGAFAVHRNAERLIARLRDHGIAASISPRRRESGRTLYFVRCAPLPDWESAGTVAEKAQAFLGTAVLIGRSVRYGNS